MPELQGDVARYDLNNPEDLAFLIERGLIWKGGPKSVQKALRAIQSGDVPRPTRNVPPEVDAFLTKLGVPPATAPVEQSGVPAEPADGLDPQSTEVPNAPPTA